MAFNVVLTKAELKKLYRAINIYGKKRMAKKLKLAESTIRGKGCGFRPITVKQFYRIANLLDKENIDWEIKEGN